MVVEPEATGGRLGAAQELGQDDVQASIEVPEVLRHLSAELVLQAEDRLVVRLEFRRQIGGAGLESLVELLDLAQQVQVVLPEYLVQLRSAP
jgi:hypothetical protein